MSVIEKTYSIECFAHRNNLQYTLYYVNRVATIVSHRIHVRYYIGIIIRGFLCLIIFLIYQI